MLVRLVIGLNSLVSLYIEHRTAAAVLGYYCMKLYQLSGNRSVKNALEVFIWEVNGWGMYPTV